MLLLYSSDLHGNLDHASVLVREANSRGVDALLLGGDLAPRREQLIRERKLSSLDGVVEGIIWRACIGELVNLVTY